MNVFGASQCMIRFSLAAGNTTTEVESALAAVKCATVLLCG